MCPCEVDGILRLPATSLIIISYFGPQRTEDVPIWVLVGWKSKRKPD